MAQSARPTPRCDGYADNAAQRYEKSFLGFLTRPKSCPILAVAGQIGPVSRLWLNNGFSQR